MLWAATWAALQFSFWLALLVAIPACAFLVRLFLIQHDCGHGAMFKKKASNDWVGRVLGVFTMTPYDVWRKQHSLHHASHGNLDKRGMGDIDTLTLQEYRALSAFKRLLYRMYRHPIVMFGLGPSFVFFILYRYPSGLLNAGWLYWISAMGTNLGIPAAGGLMMWWLGIRDWVRHAKFNVTQGKNWDSSGSIGPWMTTIDETWDLAQLHLTTRVNGELRQDDTPATMAYPIDYQIEYLSTFCTLEPGDLIFTGTPIGAGARFDPPRFLAPGDVVEVAVPELGVLRNTVADEVLA